MTSPVDLLNEIRWKVRFIRAVALAVSVSGRNFDFSEEEWCGFGLVLAEIEAQITALGVSITAR